MRRLVPVVALAVVLAAAYWFDGILPGIRKATATTFDPVPGVWTETIAKFAAAIAVAGLGWLLFVWSSPSRLTGLVYALVGGLLLLWWPLTWSFKVALPEFAFGLSLRLSVDGLLNLTAPFLTVMGLVRLVWSARPAHFSVSPS